MKPVGVAKPEAVVIHDEVKGFEDGGASIGRTVLAGGEIVTNAEEGVVQVNAGIHGNDGTRKKKTHASKGGTRQAVQVFLEGEGAGKEGWEGFDECVAEADNQATCQAHKARVLPETAWTLICLFSRPFFSLFLCNTAPKFIIHFKNIIITVLTATRVKPP